MNSALIFQLPLTLYEISALSAIVPVIIGVSFLKQLDNALRVILFLSLISCMVDLYAIQLVEMGRYNVGLLNAFLPFQLIITLFYFVNLDSISPSIHKKIFYSFFFVSFLVVAFSVYMFSTEKFNSEILVFSTFGVLYFCFLYYYNLMKNEFDTPLWLSPHFFIVSGLFLYQSSLGALFISFRYFDPDVIPDLWVMKLVGYIFFNVLISYGMFVQRKTRRHG